MFDLILQSQPERFFHDADLPLATRLRRAFEQIAIDPARHPNIKNLTGEWAGYLRYRVGDWRVVYRIEHAAKVVQVVAIAHRSKVY